MVVRGECDVWGVDEGLPLAHALSTLCLVVVVEQCIVVDFTNEGMDVIVQVPADGMAMALDGR